MKKSRHRVDHHRAHPARLRTRHRRGRRHGMTAKAFKGLELRNIGPALMSGRIADIAIHPEIPASGMSRWAREGCGRPSTPARPGSRSSTARASTPPVASPSTRPTPRSSGSAPARMSAAATWDSATASTAAPTAAAAGRRWVSRTPSICPRSSSTPRILRPSLSPPRARSGLPAANAGLFKTTDGGATWKNILSAGEWTGVTDVVMDPRDPDVLYAATWQHHRTVAALIDGGPESGIHKSVDGGATWTRLTEGLPKGNMGKIGLAISPQKPDVLYAAIELDNSKGGVWRSTNRGATWEKRSDAVAGATGPHYYQELVASPHAFDRIYLMDFRVQVSDDGGTTFRRPQGGGQALGQPRPGLPARRPRLVAHGHRRRSL